MIYRYEALVVMFSILYTNRGTLHGSYAGGHRLHYAPNHALVRMRSRERNIGVEQTVY